MDRVAGLLLAAGGGRRIGTPKALLRNGEQLLVDRALGVLREAGCAELIVVLGAGADRVRAEAELAGATVVVNPAWGTGQGGSLRAGLAALSETSVEAVVVLLVDTPGVTAEAVRRVAALPYPEALVCATYVDRRGHPMLLGRAHWAGIAALADGDVGARPYLRERASDVLEVACDGISSDADIDTVEAAEAWGLSVPADAVPAVETEPPAAVASGVAAVPAEASAEGEVAGSSADADSPTAAPAAATGSRSAAGSRPKPDRPLKSERPPKSVPGSKPDR